MAEVFLIHELAFAKLFREKPKSLEDLYALSKPAMRRLLWHYSKVLNNDERKVYGFEMALVNGKIFFFFQFSDNTLLQIIPPWGPKLTKMARNVHDFREFPLHFSWLDHDPDFLMRHEAI